MENNNERASHNIATPTVWELVNIEGWSPAKIASQFDDHLERHGITDCGAD